MGARARSPPKNATTSAAGARADPAATRRAADHHRRLRLAHQSQPGGEPPRHTRLVWGAVTAGTCSQRPDRPLSAPRAAGVRDPGRVVRVSGSTGVTRAPGAHVSARVDWLVPGKALVDIKTVGRVGGSEPSSFGRQCAQLDYPLQANALHRRLGSRHGRTAAVHSSRRRTEYGVLSSSGSSSTTRSALDEPGCARPYRVRRTRIRRRLVRHSATTPTTSQISRAGLVRAHRIGAHREQKTPQVAEFTPRPPDAASQATLVEQQRAIAEVRFSRREMPARPVTRKRRCAGVRIRTALRAGVLPRHQTEVRRVERPPQWQARTGARVGKRAVRGQGDRRDDVNGVSQVPFAWDVQTNTICPSGRSSSQPTDEKDDKDSARRPDRRLPEQPEHRRAGPKSIFTVLPTYFVEMAEVICRRP